MKLLLLRHGETDGNRDRRYIGRTDLPLNATGHQQAQAAAEALRHVAITEVHHSPLLRARQTAAAVAAGRSLPMFEDPRLAEVDFGEWEGLTYSEIEARDRERVWAWYDDPWQLAPPGGETLAQLDARVMSWLRDTTARLGTTAGTGTSTVLVVAHGGPLRWLRATLEHANPALFWQLRCATGSWYELEVPARHLD